MALSMNYFSPSASLRRDFKFWNSSGDLAHLLEKFLIHFLAKKLARKTTDVVFLIQEIYQSLEVILIEILN